LDQFRKEEIFSENLNELDDSRNVVQDLVDEYEAATKSDYLQWGLNRLQVSCGLILHACSEGVFIFRFSYYNYNYK